MKITNKFDLPQALVDAVRNDPYTNGGAWRSVTQLIAPPRQVVLKKMFDDQIEVDVSERLYALYGQIVHDILKRANTVDMVEDRLFTECAGRKISGGYDVLQLEKGKLIDWKFSTIYKLMGGDKFDWEAQTNLLAMLCRRQLGVEIRELEIILLGRDHSKRKARLDPNYPKLPVARVPIRLWSWVEQDTYLDKRVQLHLEAEQTLPLCNRGEKWQKPDIWAVCNNTGTTIGCNAEDTRTGYRAIPGGLCDSLEKAQACISGKTQRKYFIQRRPGENTRCLDYCEAANFCAQFLQESQEKLNGPKRQPGNEQGSAALADPNSGAPT